MRRSIQDVGLWESLILRPSGNRKELAFGHHRLEASKLELGAEARVPVIVRDLTDKQMLEFMGRENLEVMNANAVNHAKGLRLGLPAGGVRFLGELGTAEPELAGRDDLLLDKAAKEFAGS